MVLLKADTIWTCSLVLFQSVQLSLYLTSREIKQQKKEQHLLTWLKDEQFISDVEDKTSEDRKAVGQRWAGS